MSYNLLKMFGLLGFLSKMTPDLLKQKRLSSVKADDDNVDDNIVMRAKG